MAENQLTTTSAPSGTQTITQSPQISTSTPSTAASSRVQPGTASDLLNSEKGITLHSTALPSVNLQTFVAPARPATVPAAQRHIHPALFGLSAILLIAAVILFWTSAQSAKNTTISRK